MEHQDYSNAVELAINKIGRSGKTAPPPANDEASAAAQEYAIAKAAFDAAEARMRAARHKLLEAVPAPKDYGKHILVDGKLVTCIAQVKKGATRIDQEALFVRLVKAGIHMDDARALIEASKTQDKDVVYLTVVLKA